ncbi:MAG: hypothetical protein CM15mP128_5580 [Methanobacteriota archaeon]|nr:MAG: hypothetical protein CM15mP128_5580 [Euryarchaeota archaeon]
MPRRPRTSALDERVWMAVPRISRRKRLKSVTVRSPSGKTMAHVIVADGNEGRRSLLANTLEREGFQVTRASTLRQAVGTTVRRCLKCCCSRRHGQTGILMMRLSRFRRTLRSAPAPASCSFRVTPPRRPWSAPHVLASLKCLANPSTWPASSPRCTRMLRSARWRRLRTFPCKAWVGVDSPRICRSTAGDGRRLMGDARAPWPAWF